MMLEVNEPISDEPASVVYDDNGMVRPQFIEQVVEAIESGKSELLVALIDPLHESELGDLLEALDRDQRVELVRISGNTFDFASLTGVDESVRLEVVNAIPNEQIADAVKELDSDDAVFILEDMEKEDQEEILSRLPYEEQLRLRRSLDYPDESAGRRMQTEFIAVPPFWTVGQTIDFMRNEHDLPDRFHEIFVVGTAFELLGSVALDHILRTQRKVKIQDITGDVIHSIDANDDQEEAAWVFEQYDLISAAVIDESKRLVGVLTIDDVVDVMQMEADEDIKRLAGVGDEELSDNVLDTARSRFTWLLVNLATAIAASSIIAIFDATIQEMVALAILMPIVASMGGNAGTQSMTVTVRALAMRDIDRHNVYKIIRREFLVGLLNGVLFAVIMGLIAVWWFANTTLGLIIAIAMIINMIFAALSGILVPITLNRINIDPAIASSVFVTMVTDVVGFLAFLGLAAWWFGV